MSTMGGQLRSRQAVTAAFAFLLGTLSATACLADSAVEKPLAPLPAPAPGLDSRRVAIRQRLFFELRPSADSQLSGSSCHDLTHGGADPPTFSVGVGGAISPVNAPTLLNSGFSFRQNGDGGAETLEDRARVILRYQLGKTARDEHRANIVSLLRLLPVTPPPNLARPP